MKKYLFIFVFFILGLSIVFADGRPVSVDALPQTAKDFIFSNFSGAEIRFVVVEGRDFQVILSDGTEFDFDRKGNWEVIKCRSGVSANFLPKMASDYINATYPDTYIVEIDKDWNKYEVKLANRWELRFNKKGNIRRVDYDD